MQARRGYGLATTTASSVADRGTGADPQVTSRTVEVWIRWGAPPNVWPECAGGPVDGNSKVPLSGQGRGHPGAVRDGQQSATFGYDARPVHHGCQRRSAFTGIADAVSTGPARVSANASGNWYASTSIRVTRGTAAPDGKLVLVWDSGEWRVFTVR